LTPTDRKRTCFLAAPTYDGTLTVGAALGMFRASAGGIDVAFFPWGSSLLAMTFNVCWAGALNRAHRGLPTDLFAMQHADIEPEEFWLDKLVAEMDARDLDVLGVVAPIKSPAGLTSVAMGRKDGDPWRVHGRLTMREVWNDLPETFTSDDLGYPLLINTGLWVCRFAEDWARQVRFTINDRICFDPKKDLYFVQSESEDWYFSRLLHEMGKRVGCTRKVKLGHRGHATYSNAHAWGERAFDAEYLAASAVAPPPPAEWFPHDVAGWLTEAEGRELAELARDKNVLEVGAYCGRSTICLAKTAHTVGTVDTFDGRGTDQPGNTFPLFEKNLKRYGVTTTVKVYRGESAAMLPLLPPVYDLVFIDGSHDRPSVARDAELAAAVLAPGGLLAFHDYSDRDKGVMAAVDELIAGGAHLLKRVDSLAVIRPSTADSLVRA
jgi:protein-L-isoaspartate O-methyltransferase